MKKRNDARQSNDAEHRIDDGGQRLRDATVVSGAWRVLPTGVGLEPESEGSVLLSIPRETYQTAVTLYDR